MFILQKQIKAVSRLTNGNCIPSLLFTVESEEKNWCSCVENWHYITRGSCLQEGKLTGIWGHNGIILLWEFLLTVFVALTTMRLCHCIFCLEIKTNLCFLIFTPQAFILSPEDNDQIPTQYTYNEWRKFIQVLICFNNSVNIYGCHLLCMYWNHGSRSSRSLQAISLKDSFVQIRTYMYKLKFLGQCWRSYVGKVILDFRESKI